MRIVTHTITDENKLSFSPYQYSLFKHGSRSIAIRFAQELARTILEEKGKTFRAVQEGLGSHIQIAVFGAPYNGVKTASSYLAEFVTDFLNQYFKRENVSVEFVECKIRRQHSYTQDYSTMPGSDRETALTSETFEFVPPVQEIQERFVYALFVDDVLITGAHERRIQELIARENLTIEHDFCYYALLTEGCCEPQFEDRINNTAFSNLPMVFPTAIGARLVDGDFLPNTRIMKRILSLEKNLLEELLKGTIITELSYWNLLLLVEHAELNNYHTHDTYKENYNIILNKLEHVRFTEK